ncbi:hypothetical protein [Thiomicrorhabdus sp.]|uniref:hypothetical protein n=1 Tax=Thiomicrorhabdus sp. TaxID=2039724 RepID=UPI0029C6AA5B|nr:hypothetical protein [Thiomicrorhabdus sp.]
MPTTIEPRFPNLQHGLHGFRAAETAKSASLPQEGAESTAPADWQGELRGESLPQFSASSQTRAQQAYAYSNTMSLQLSTQDGDKITVDFRQLFAYFQAQSESQKLQSGPEGVQYFSRRSELEASAFSEAFGFAVEGDIDEEELAAIKNVFEQVNELAQDFFGGNLDEALQHAMEFDIDFEQLQSMSLSLTHTETRTSLYEQTSQLSRPVFTEKAQQSEPKATMQALPDYLQKWQNALQQLSVLFSDGKDFVDHLESKNLALQDPQQRSEAAWLDRVETFHSQLLEWAGLGMAANADAVSAESEIENTLSD